MCASVVKSILASPLTKGELTDKDSMQLLEQKLLKSLTMVFHFYITFCHR